MFSQNELEKIRAARELWEETALQRSLARNPERAQKFITTSSDEIERLYTPTDIAGMDYARDVNDAGAYPFTRGPHATMYRSKVWTMRMFAGFGTAEETNARFKYLLEHGETGLSTAFDMPTLYGFDTDAPQALGEFGKCGVAISSLADMEILFDGIPVDQVTTSMTINSPAAMIWAMYIAAAEKRGIPRAQLGGTLQNDILKEYIAQKEFIFPPEPSNAARHRYNRIWHARTAEMEHDFDFGVSHPRSGFDGGARIGVHAVRRFRICALGDCARFGGGRFRAAPFVLF